ncbi:hypothetical protein K3495_g5184 [Podosphaera aphanis]|nr:hypothetical protein K3495_g5184 [Podosphaera aphanis]
MGWFWGPSNPNPGNQDPLRNLDPGLRDYLKRESPVKYEATPPPPTADWSTAPASTTTDSTHATHAGQEAPASPPPPPTLFPDGRYNDLWKTYQSQAQVDNSMKSDQEKIDEVLEGFKYRRTEIGKAALENCAMEQTALSDCWTNGGAVARLTLCKAENQAFHRCHTMQSKFMKALGYLSSFDRPPEVDEQIQMHADTLYHRMLEEEKMIEAARAQGKPEPVFPPLLSQKPVFEVNPETEFAKKDVDQLSHQPSELKESVRQGLKERLEGLTPLEREIEEQTIKAEIRASENLGGSLTAIFEKQEQERKLRKERGKETIGDKIVSIFGARG